MDAQRSTDKETRPIVNADQTACILHLSSDYLDPIRPPPLTDAVRRLVDRLSNHRQLVISLQRVSDPRKTFWRDFGTVDGRRLIVHAYFAPAFGIGMFWCQWRVAKRIRRFLAKENIRPDIVHAHRFTFEGIAAWLLARRFAAALFFSVRGEVEGKVFSAKPFYRPLFRRMARDATRLYFVSAWFKTRFVHHTGIAPTKAELLPNIVHNACRTMAETAVEPRIVIAMSLRAIDKKGLPDLLRAFASAGNALDGVTLEIIGEGPQSEQERVQQLIAENGLSGRAILQAPMKNADLLAYFSSSLGVAMPSFNETFGMVYAEALFAGCPILYSRGTGIDGYLDGLPVGVAVTPGDTDSISNGLIKLVSGNASMRTAIRDNIDVLCERLHPDEVIERYQQAVCDVMGRKI